MERLEFEDEKGVMCVYDTEVHLIYYERESAGRKYPLYGYHNPENRKILYNCVKIINLHGYLLDEQALEKFDKIIAKYEEDDE